MRVAHSIDDYIVELLDVIPLTCVGILIEQKEYLHEIDTEAKDLCS